MHKTIWIALCGSTILSCGVLGQRGIYTGPGYDRHEGHCAPDPTIYGCRFPQEYGGAYNGDGTCGRNRFCTEFRGVNTTMCAARCNAEGDDCVAFEEALGRGLACRLYHQDGNVSRGSSEGNEGERWCDICPHHCGRQASRADCYIKQPTGPTAPPTTPAPTTPRPTFAPAPTFAPSTYSMHEGHCAPSREFVDEYGCRNLRVPTLWNGAGQCNTANFCREFPGQDAAFCLSLCNSLGPGCVAYEEALGGGLKCRIYSPGGNYSTGSFPEWCDQCEHNCNNHAGRGDCWVKDLATSAPTAAPTGVPTRHACNDGSHGCDQTEHGICEQIDNTNGYRCSCVSTHRCSDGDCTTPGHTCVLITAAPTLAPTVDPTSQPTVVPSWTPSPEPTTVRPTPSPTPPPTRWTWFPTRAPSTSAPTENQGPAVSGAAEGNEDTASSAETTSIAIAVAVVIVLIVAAAAVLFVKKQTATSRGGEQVGFENPMYDMAGIDEDSNVGGSSGYMDVGAAPTSASTGYMDVSASTPDGDVSDAEDI